MTVSIINSTRGKVTATPLENSESKKNKTAAAYQKTFRSLRRNCTQAINPGR